MSFARHSKKNPCTAEMGRCGNSVAAVLLTCIVFAFADYIVCTSFSKHHACIGCTSKRAPLLEGCSRVAEVGLSGRRRKVVQMVRYEEEEEVAMASAPGPGGPSNPGTAGEQRPHCAVIW